MKQVALSTLENAIIKPGFEKQLKPLIMYRGNMPLGRAHRLWNLLVSGMEQDCESADITQRLWGNPQFSHLCGSEKPVISQYLTSFVVRLLDNPKVLQENRHLEDYVRGLFPHYRLHEPPQRVSETSYRAGHLGAGGWRRLGKIERHLTGGNIKQKAPIVYPFLIHDGGKPEHDLLRRVNAAVPKYLDPDLRADICQDIVVGILCGDFAEDNLSLPVKEMTKRVQKMFPTKYGPLSLDAVMPGTDDFRLIDRISNEDSLWARI